MDPQLQAATNDVNDLDTQRRADARTTLSDALAAGNVTPPPLSGAVNVHLHTFFSFNAEDYSPSGIAWEAKMRGLDVVGSVDFDVLDAMDELFAAGDAFAIRTVAALETRVFVDAYADKDINSPGEPGVSYFMGTGFTRLPEAGTPAAATLQRMRDGARARNVALLDRIADTIAPLTLDYDAEVDALTPSGNATERHMLAALDTKARQMYPGEKELAAYWANTLGMDAEAIPPLLSDPAALRNTIRKKLMKRGGPGYVQPDASTFPPLQDVIAMIQACHAIPCTTWLDGTSAGESDAERLLDDFLARGCIAVNIVPDRNWNISDEETKKIKTDKLREFVTAARERDLIISVGTEMNNYGLKFVDTFDAPELQPYAEDFRNGAYMLYGHTLLERACEKGRMSAWAEATFGDDRAKANAFYLAVGQQGFPPVSARETLAQLPVDTVPAAICEALN